MGKETGERGACCREALGERGLDPGGSPCPSPMLSLGPALTVVAYPEGIP